MSSENFHQNNTLEEGNFSVESTSYLAVESKFLQQGNSYYSMLHSPKQICRYFNSVTGCKLKTNCTFVHSKTSSHLSGTHHQDDPLKEENFLDSAEGGVETSNLNNQKTKQKDEVSLPTKGIQQDQQKVCFSFSNKGWCRFGKRCRFIHSIDETGNRKGNREKKNGNAAQKSEDLNSDDLEITLRDDLPVPEKNRKDKSIVERGTGRQDRNNVTRKSKGSSALSTDDLEITLRNDPPVIDKNQQQSTNVGRRSQRVCTYFQAGRCWNGNRCRFLHPKEHPKQTKNPDGKLESVSKKDSSEHTRNFVNKRQQHVNQTVQRIPISRESVPDAELARMKKVDCDVVKKRFSKDKVKVIVENENESVFQVDFSPSDPDWPFDAKVFRLLVNFSKDYPLKLFTILLPEDQDLPETVRR